MSFDLSDADIQRDSALRTVTLAWNGSAESDGSEAAGLEVWRTGRFRSTQDVGFDRDEQGWTSSHSDELRRLRYHYEGGDALTFAVMPDGFNGTRAEYARVSTDHAALIIRYRQAP